MDIVFTKISDAKHSVRVHRSDKSVDEIVLDSRSFLRHDLAHLAVEWEVPLTCGYWGSVVGGATLAGSDIRGKEIAFAESLTGPVQTLMRLEADTEEYLAMLTKIQPELASTDLASRIRERGRQLQGHWKATAYGKEMLIEWDESPVITRTALTCTTYHAQLYGINFIKG